MRNCRSLAHAQSNGDARLCKSSDECISEREQRVSDCNEKPAAHQCIGSDGQEFRIQQLTRALSEAEGKGIWTVVGGEDLQWKARRPTDTGKRNAGSIGPERPYTILNSAKFEHATHYSYDVSGNSTSAWLKWNLAT